MNLMFTGPCIFVIVEEQETNLMSLALLFHFLCAQNVSDINIPIIRSLRLFCWITTLVVLFWFDVCWSFGVVGLEWYPWCWSVWVGQTSCSNTAALQVIWQVKVRPHQNLGLSVWGYVSQEVTLKPLELLSVSAFLISVANWSEQTLDHFPR